MPLVEREGLPQKIIAQVRRLIAAGHWQPGSKLPPERELTVLFGVSRTALREALSILSAYGILRIHHGGGIYLAESLDESILEPLGFVLPVNQSTLLELMAVRKLLEVGAIELATKLATESDLADLRQAVEDIQNKLATLEERVKAGVRFHMAIARASRNKLLQRMLSNLIDLFVASHRVTLSFEEGVLAGQQDHLEILQIIESRNPERAKQAMLRHLEVTEQQLLRLTRAPSEKKGTRHATKRPGRPRSAQTR